MIADESMVNSQRELVAQLADPPQQVGDERTNVAPFCEKMKTSLADDNGGRLTGPCSFPPPPASISTSSPSDSIVGIYFRRVQWFSYTALCNSHARRHPNSLPKTQDNLVTT
jgi:hypothetical protein